MKEFFMGDKPNNQAPRTPSESTSPDLEGPTETLAQQESTAGRKDDKGAHTRKPKVILNILLSVILMAVAAGFYLYQKGYLNSEVPFLHAPLSEQSSSFAQDENDSAPQAPPKAMVSAQQFQTLEHRVVQLENQVRQLNEALQGTGMAPEGVATLNQKGVFYLDLKYKALSGYPFVAELEQAKSVLTDTDYSSLKELAPVGMPAFEQLKKELPAVLRVISREQESEQATSISAKMLAQLKHLIEVENLTAQENSFLGQDGRAFTPEGLPGIIEKVAAAQAHYPRLAADERLTQWLRQAQAHHKIMKILHNIQVKG
jgi:hypothetical protein